MAEGASEGKSQYYGEVAYWHTIGKTECLTAHSQGPRAKYMLYPYYALLTVTLSGMKWRPSEPSTKANAICSVHVDDGSHGSGAFPGTTHDRAKPKLTFHRARGLGGLEDEEQLNLHEHVAGQDVRLYRQGSGEVHSRITVNKKILQPMRKQANGVIMQSRWCHSASTTDRNAQSFLVPSTCTSKSSLASFVTFASSTAASAALIS